MLGFTLHDLHCFDAVLRHGGFQAAALELHRSHPAVFAAVARLERELGLTLLDRSGYRVRATDAGTSFHRRVQHALREMDDLRAVAVHLAAGEESDLRVVIGDLCPRRALLALLSNFFGAHPRTRLHLHFEAVGGPQERLLDGDADLILHPVDRNDPRLEWIEVGAVPLTPVVAPGFLKSDPSAHWRPEQLRGYTQCVIRDTATRGAGRDYYLVEGAQRCTVADQQMKMEIILQAMAWGHLPAFLIGEALRDGRLLSIAGPGLPGSVETLVAARRRDRAHGPVATKLWETIRQQAPHLQAGLAAQMPA